MRVIDTVEEYLKAMSEETPMPASVMDTAGYANLGFECGCGEWHGVNDPSIRFF